MNKLTIIGNLTRDPDLRVTTTGISVCSFTVAVNRKRKVEGQPEADYFDVTAWREKGELCGKFLQKGKKVCVIGAVGVRTYTSERDGLTRARLEVTADEVEFLSPRVSDIPAEAPAPANESPREVDESTGFDVVDTDELPF